MVLMRVQVPGAKFTCLVLVLHGRSSGGAGLAEGMCACAGCASAVRMVLGVSLIVRAARLSHGGLSDVASVAAWRLCAAEGWLREHGPASLIRQVYGGSPFCMQRFITSSYKHAH